MKVALIGGGSSFSRRVLRDLAELAAVGEVLYQPGESENGDLPDGCRRWDGDLDGVGAVVGMATDEAKHLSSAKAAVAAGVPYLSVARSVQLTQRLLGLNSEGSADRVRVVLSLGFTSAISGVLASLAAEELGDLHRIVVSWAASVSGPWGMAGFIEAVGAYASGDTPDGNRTGTTYFPEPLGWRKVRSLGGPEEITLPLTNPGAGVEVFGGLADRRSNAVARRSARVRGPLQRRSQFARFLESGRSQETWCSVRLDAESASGAASFAVVDHLPNLVSAPIVDATFLVASGEAKGVGATLYETLAPTQRLLELLAKRGVRAARLEPGVA